MTIIEDYERMNKLKKIFESPFTYLRRRFVTINGIEMRWIGDERLDPNSKNLTWPIVMVVVGRGILYHYDLAGRCNPQEIRRGWDIKEIIPFVEGDSLSTF